MSNNNNNNNNKKVLKEGFSFYSYKKVSEQFDKKARAEQKERPKPKTGTIQVRGKREEKIKIEF